MASLAYKSTESSSATNSSTSSRRDSSEASSLSSVSAAAVSPFQSWLVDRNAPSLIPRPLAELEAIFTPLTHFYPDHWACAPFSADVTRNSLSAILSPTARPAQVAAKLRACAQLGKVLWNLSNADAARLLVVLDQWVVGCRVLLDADTVERFLGNGSCDFYPEVRRELGLEEMERPAWVEWWARREAWVRERRVGAKSWDLAVGRVLRELADRRGTWRLGGGEG